MFSLRIVGLCKFSNSIGLFHFKEEQKQTGKKDDQWEPRMRFELLGVSQFLFYYLSGL